MIKLLRTDQVGAAASGLCAIHCATMPFVIATLPFWGLGFLAHPAFEGAMIAFSLLLAIGSIGHSYRRHHRKLLPVYLLVLGFLLIASGHVLEVLHTLVPLGGIVVAAAHLVNLRLNRQAHSQACTCR